MKNRAMCLTLACAALLVAAVPPAATAQPAAARDAGRTSVSLSVTPVYQFESDFDRGGSFSVQRVGFNVDTSTKTVPAGDSDIGRVISQDPTSGKQADKGSTVKIVVGEESWEVAKSANYQNEVSRIELELARFLRPQVVRKIATDLGYSLGATAEPSISNVLEDIHHTKVSYEAIRLLYIGVFTAKVVGLFLTGKRGTARWRGAVSGWTVLTRPLVVPG